MNFRDFKDFTKGTFCGTMITVKKVDWNLKTIAHIRTEYGDKFGIPRQSGMETSFPATIIFEPEYRDLNAVKGLEGFSYIWVLWEFSKTEQTKWSPTVRPPRLGGNRRMGVFATRSPFRPNPIGLSSLKLESIELSKTNGPLLHVKGADILDMTPIYDIKPYLPFCDSHPDALSGFAGESQDYRLNVDFRNNLTDGIDGDVLSGITEALALDPRPSYQDDPNRVYKADIAGCSVEFTVQDGTVYVERLIKR